MAGVHIWLVLMKAHHAILAHSSRTLRSSGLGDSDFRVLEALLHKGPLPVNVIGPKVFLTPGSISIAVDRLCERGLVSREADQKDRRVRTVTLTPAGRTLIKQVFQSHAQEMEALASVLSTPERSCLLRALKKLGKHAASGQASLVRDDS